jgi:cellulase/cellobiase CelA1
VGEGFRVTLANVHSSGPVYGTGDNGGLMGVAVQSNITGSSASGLVHCPDFACSRVGGLVGQARHSSITASFATGNVGCTETGHCTALGGLVGQASQSTISASFATGDVLCFDCSQVGGLIGEALEASLVSGSFSAGRVDCEANCSQVGGLLGASSQSVVSSYWSRDSSTQATSAGAAVSATLAQLQCATPTSGGACAPVPLFAGWSSYTDPAGTPYWHFGTATELPGLCLSGKVYRDANADGQLEPPASCGGGVLQATINIYDQFTGGYCARLTVTNTGASAVEPWSVTFAVQGTLNQAWNMTYTQSGGSVTAGPVNWNPRLEPGQSTHDIGFCAAL